MPILEELDKLKKEGKLDDFLYSLPADELKQLTEQIKAERQANIEKNKKQIESLGQGFTPKKELKDVPKDILSSFGYSMNQLGLTGLRALANLFHPTARITSEQLLKQKETQQRQAKDQLTSEYLQQPAKVKYPFLIGQNTLNNIPALIAGVMAKNPNLALGVFGGQAALQDFPYEEEKAKQAGLTGLEKQITPFLQSANVGMIEAGTEVLPYGQLFRAGKFLPKFAKAATFEATGEVLNQIAEDLLDRYVYNAEARKKMLNDPKQIAKDLVDMYSTDKGKQELLDTIIVSVGSMGLLTGGMHLLNKTFEKPEARKVAKEGIEKINEGIKQEDDKKIKEGVEKVVEAEVIDNEINNLIKAEKTQQKKKVKEVIQKVKEKQNKRKEEAAKAKEEFKKEAEKVAPEIAPEIVPPQQVKPQTQQPEKPAEERDLRLDEVFNPSLPDDVLNKNFEILKTLHNARAGFRYRDNEGNWHRVPSSFPKWIPEEYRKKDLLDKVYNAFAKQKPPKEGTKARDLYELALSRMRQNAGLEGIKPEEIQNVDVFEGTTAEVKPKTEEEIKPKPEEIKEEITKKPEIPEEKKKEEKPQELEKPTTKNKENEVEKRLLNKTIQELKKATGVEGLKRVKKLKPIEKKVNEITATKKREGQYSTPIELSYVLQDILNIKDNDKVYEPTAGTGMLLFKANPENIIANELDKERYNILKEQFPEAKITNFDASEYIPEEKVDVVIGNPPFGLLPKKVDFNGFKIGKLDHLIVLKSLEAMKDNGRAGFIIGGHIGKDLIGKDKGLTSNDKNFLAYLYSRYKVKNHVNLDKHFFKTKGTTFPTQMIIIEGRRETPIPVEDLNLDFSNIPTIKTAEELYNFLKNKEVSDYVKRIQGNTATDREGVEGLGEGHRQTTAVEGHTERKQGQHKSNTNRQSSKGGNGRNANVGVSEPSRVETTNRETKRTGKSRSSDNKRPDKAIRNVEEKETKVKELPPEEEIQAKYKPKSKGKNLGQLIPAGLKENIEKALDDIESKVGDIDEYVRKELGYNSLDELYNSFHAGQIDALALALYNIKTNGQGFILGDMTGAGKGRVVAGVLKSEVLEGNIPIFFTEKDTLFTDIYRDAVDIGFNEFKPFIVNSNSKILDKDGNVVFKTDNKDIKEIKKLLKNNEYDKVRKLIENKGYNTIVVTYSQVATSQGNWQKQFLNIFARDNVVTLDESHNAAGQSNTGDYIKQLIGNAKGVLYSSATYAKRPDTLPLYYRTAISDSELEPEELVDTIIRGGEPLAEVIAQNLAQAGQYIRRELSFEGVKYETDIDFDNETYYKDLYNKVIDVYNEILKIDRIKQKIVSKLNNVAKKQLAATEIDKKSLKGFNPFTSTPLFNQTHSFIGNLLLALKASKIKKIVEDTVKENKKPVITLMNTNESVLENIIKDEDYEVDKAISFDFKDILRYKLKKALSYKENKLGGKSEEKYLDPNNDPKLREEYQKALRKINSLKIDLPASPIDYIKKEIEDLGLKVGEITGRNYYIDLSGDVPVLRKRVKEDKDRTSTINKFNNGELDALIFNAAGSTGISLHASEKFKDKRPRKMLIIQANPDINQYVQTLGRIHRTGQVYHPEYSLIQTPLPAELRLALFLERKMKMLNANTSGKTKGKVNLDIPDMFNKYGDTVAKTFLLENRKLADKLGIDLGDNKTGYIPNLMKKLTGRIAVLPVEEQKVILQQLTEMYNDEVNEAKAKGEYDLETIFYDFKAQPLIKIQKVKGEDELNPFKSSVYLEALLTKSLKKPYTRAKIEDIVKKKIKSKEYAKKYNETLYKQIEKDYAIYTRRLQKDLLKVEADEFKKDLETIKSYLDLYTIGGTYYLRALDTIGVLIDIKYTKGNETNPLSPSRIKFLFAIPTSQQTASLTRTKLLDVPSDKLDDWITEDWDSLTPPDSYETRYVLTGNLLKAVTKAPTKKVQIINYSTKDGEIKKGILLPQSFKLDISNETVELPPDKIISEVKKLEGDPLFAQEKVVGITDYDGYVYIYFNTKKTLAEAFPSYRFALSTQQRNNLRKYYEEKLSEIAGKEPVKFRKGWAIKHIPEDKAKQVIKFLTSNGIRFERKLSRDELKFEDMPYIPSKQNNVTKLFNGNVWVYDNIIVDDYGYSLIGNKKNIPKKDYKRPIDLISEELRTGKWYKVDPKSFKLSTEDLILKKERFVKFKGDTERKVKREVIDFLESNLDNPEYYIVRNRENVYLTAVENNQVKFVRKIEYDWGKEPDNSIMPDTGLKLYSGIPVDELVKQTKKAVQQIKKLMPEDRIGINNDLRLVEKLFIPPQFSKRKSINSIYKIFRQGQELKQETIFDLYKKLDGEGELYLKMKELGIRDAFRDLLVLLDKKTRELIKLEAKEEQLKIIEEKEKNNEEYDLKEVIDESYERVINNKQLSKFAKRILEAVANKHKLNTSQKQLLEELYTNWLSVTTDIRNQILDIFEEELNKSKNPTLLKRLKLQMGQLKYYFPRFREAGNWEVRVLDEKGRVVYAKFHDLYKPGLWAITQAKVEKELKNKYPEDKYIIEWRPAFQYNDVIGESINPLTLERLIDASLEKIKDTEVDENIANAFEEAVRQQVVNALKSKGFLSHTIRRSKRQIEGYETEKIEEVISKFFNAFGGFLSKRYMAERFKDVLDSVPERNYRERKTVAKMIQFLLRNETSYDRASGRLRSFIFLYSLGFKPSFALVNLTQTGLTTFPYLAKLIGSKKAFISVNKGVATAAKLMKHFITKNKEIKFIEKRPEDIDEETYKAVMHLLKTGILENMISEYRGDIKGKLIGKYEKFVDLSAKLASWTEVFNRLSAYLSYYYAMKDELTEKELFQNAEDFTLKTQFDYQKGNLPIFLQELEGIPYAVMRTAYTFRHYIVSLFNLYKEMGFLSTYTIASLMILALIGGLGSLPIYFLLDWLWEKTTGYPFYVYLRRVLGDERLADAVNYGLPSLTGITLQPQMSINIPFIDTEFNRHKPDSSLDQLIGYLTQELFGVSYGVLDNLYRGANLMAKGDIEKGVEYAVPVAEVRYLLKALREHTEGVTTVSGKDIITGGEQLKLSKKEALGEALGASPVNKTKYYELRGNLIDIKEKYNEKKRALYIKYRKAIKSKNKGEIQKVVKEIRDYNKEVLKKYPEYRSLLITSNSLRRVIKPKTDKELEILIRKLER